VAGGKGPEVWYVLHSWVDEESLVTWPKKVGKVTEVVEEQSISVDRLDDERNARTIASCIRCKG
jgi:hypothetical protein